MNHTPLHPDAVDALLAPSEHWLSCEDCFEHHDAVIESLLDNGTPLSAEFRSHLNTCPACLEEAQSLLTLVAEDHHVTPAEGLARLEAELHAPSAATD